MSYPKVGQHARHLVISANPGAMRRTTIAVQAALFWMSVAVVGVAALPASVHAADAVAAQGQSVQFNVPAGSLATVLSVVAADAGINISTPPELVKGLSSQGLSGRYTVSAALAQLLANTGLEAVSGGAGNWVLRRQAGSDDKSVLPTISVTAPAFSAVTDGSGSYTTPAVTIGKIARSLKDTPQSVSVITRQQMEDRNLNLLTDVMDQATGVTRVNRNFGDNQFSMRGFLVQDANYMVDGVSGLVFSPNGWVPMDMAMYDRAEILRGSAGMLIGAGDPSGAINMVRKRPRAEKHFDFAASVGSWNNYRSEVDFGGAINDAGTLRGRAVVTYEDRKYFTDITHSKQPLFYGVIEADLTRDTTLFAGARYQKRTVDGYSVFGLPRYTNGQTIPVHRSTSLTQPWAQNDAFTKEVFADLEHRLNDQWKAKLSYNHTEAGFDQKVPIVRGAVNPLTGVGANYYTVSYRDQEVTSDGVDANLTGAFSAFGKQHEVLFGASWSKRTSDINTVNSGISPLIPVDMFNPGASIVNEPNRPAWGVQNRVTDIRYGVYGNTRLQLAEPLHLLIGTRLSWYDNETRSRVTGVKTTGATQSAQLTPYMALTYDLNKQWTAYVSYTDSFMPQSDYQTFDGKLLDPEVGSSYEAGIKGELLNGRLNTSFAVFQINKQNSAIPDPNHTTQCGNYVCSLNDNGKSTSSGFELEASGEVTSKWQIAGGYTYSKRVTEEGKIFSAETPRHMLRLSTNYKLTKQWTVGGGVSAQSGYTHQTTGRPEYDGGRAVWDLRSNYQITDHWSVAVAVANLFDKTYWISNGELARGNYYGDPRNMTVTLRGRF